MMLQIFTTAKFSSTSSPYYYGFLVAHHDKIEILSYNFPQFVSNNIYQLSAGETSESKY